MWSRVRWAPESFEKTPLFRQLAWLPHFGCDGGMDEPAKACQLCGRTSDPATEGDPPLAWSMDRTGERVSWTCSSCAAQHVRSIEAKLAPEWW
jgi:hypothetical protein